MAGEDLAENTLPFEPGPRNGLQRLPAGIVHDVERHVEDLGNANRPVGGLALDLRRPRQRVAFGSRDAFLENLLLQTEHEFAVFGMHGDNRAEIPRAIEAVNEHFIIRHDRALVGHEMFEAVDAVLAHERPHGLVHGLVPPGDGDMERIVGDRFLGPFTPLPVGFHDVLLRVRDDEVDDHRRAAGEAGRRTGIKIFAGHRAHKRQLHMSVRIDAAGHDVLAAGVDDRCAFRRVEPFTDSRYPAIVAKHVGP